MVRQTRLLILLRSCALCLAAMTTIWAVAATAETLDGAKSAGLIGEGVDGYVHLVDKSAPEDVKALVKDVNDKRRAKYEDIAKTRGAPVGDVAALAGAKLVERAPAGQYVLDSSGRWRQK